MRLPLGQCLTGVILGLARRFLAGDGFRLSSLSSVAVMGVVISIIEPGNRDLHP